MLLLTLVLLSNCMASLVFNVCACVRDSLSILKSNHPHLVDDKWILWSNTEGLAEETFSQLGIVSEAVFQANVKHGEMTSR